jgi:DNA-binding transcriptional ArsR family regulator
MTELVTTKSLPRAEFVVSLPLGLMSAMSLTCATPHFEGLDVWLLETRQRLAPAFLEEMALVLGFPGRFQRFTEQVYLTALAEDPVLDYAAFLRRLRALDEEDYARMALRALGQGVQPALTLEEVRALLADPGALTAHLEEAHLLVDPAAAQALLADLPALKGRFIGVVERFWEQAYRDAWTETLGLMERSVAFHRRQHYRLRFPDLFVAVTGRLLPRDQAGLAPERVRFVPSCYLGPYFTFLGRGRRLVVFYNCRATPVEGQARGEPGLFPVLKALADETRLQIVEMLRGREMYAQQIVDRLEISQAAVSRHLKLLVRAEVLSVRREGCAKFYTINGATLRYLADVLHTMGER